MATRGGKDLVPDIQTRVLGQFLAIPQQVLEVGPELL
jgi:hypothetical protein